ncbi:MAG: ribose import ATP-binding protein RbsA 1 [Nitrospiraceae bacterium]|nr:MAG: ribose import ATP-binding protein RbsA 1 [Nitrospiraceae bacterium]
MSPDSGTSPPAGYGDPCHDGRVTTFVLEARSVARRFGATLALVNASLDVRSGEVMGLVGANGAGKSTLVKILSGAERADAGTLRIGAWTGPSLGPHQAQDLGLATIYQEPSLVPTLSLVENIVLGRENLRWRVFLSNRRDVDAASAVLNRVGLNGHRRPASALNAAEQQLLAIAKALYRDARIMIMDEPTAALGRAEVARLFEVIDGLRAEGVAVVFVSHRLDEILHLCDRVTVLRDGVTVLVSRAAGLTEDDLVQAMIGHTIAEGEVRSVEPGPVLLEARGLGVDGRLRGIDLELREGEVVGLTGLVGSGRSRLARVLFGSERFDSGELFIHGELFRPRSPSVAIKRGIGLVPEDRKRDALFGEMSISSNVTLVRIPTLGRTIINIREELAQAVTWLRRVQLRPLTARVAASRLSGGNQQKVIVARWLYSNARILILDEPGQGIDVGAKDEIWKLIRELAAEGRAVLVISEEIDELAQVADRVLVMRAGSIVGCLPREEVTEEAVLALSLGAAQGLR